MVLNVHRNHKAYWDGEIGVGVGVEGGMEVGEERYITVRLCCLMSSDVG